MKGVPAGTLLMFIRGILAVFLCCILPSEVSGRQEFFPFLAEVNTDSVNVRAGQSTNFERLCQLKKGDEAVVLERSYSWYRIRLPAGAKVYVSDKYVRLLSRRIGEVEAENVNIRAGAGDHYTIVGQVDNGRHVDIIEKVDGWYQIAPLEHASGWVADQFLTFQSKYVPARRSMEDGSDRVSAAEKAPEPFSKPAPEQVKTQNNAEKSLIEDGRFPVTGQAERKVSVSAQGILERISGSERGALRYQLTVNGQPAYYLDGLTYIFDKFEHQPVVVDGSIDAGMGRMYPRPVVAVSKIQLLF